MANFVNLYFCALFSRMKQLPRWGQSSSLEQLQLAEGKQNGTEAPTNKGQSIFLIYFFFLFLRCALWPCLSFGFGSSSHLWGFDLYEIRLQALLVFVFVCVWLLVAVLCFVLRHFVYFHFHSHFGFRFRFRYGRQLNLLLLHLCAACGCLLIVSSSRELGQSLDLWHLAFGKWHSVFDIRHSACDWPTTLSLNNLCLYTF